MTRTFEPIPTPPAVRWREFRVRALPFVVFAAGALTAAALWTRTVAPPTLVAEAELIQSNVTSPCVGVVTAVEVSPLQRVRAGEVIGHILPDTARVLGASLAVVRAEIDLLRVGMQPALEQQRVAVNLEQLQLDWMRERVGLVELRGALRLAETNLGRIGRLHRDRLVSEEEFEVARIQRDSLASQVDEKARLVASIEPSVRRFGSDGDDRTPRATGDTLSAAIAVQEKQLALLEAQSAPIPLLAPIDGVVTMVLRRGGEMVAAEEAVATIASEHAARLVGFLRQPLPVEPAAGMPVEVRTRGGIRTAGFASIEAVGGVMEPMPPTLLAAVNRTGALDTGLRLHVGVPTEIHLRPGEQVDVIIRDR
jgi:multidrug resistance efflux pump